MAKNLETTCEMKEPRKVQPMFMRFLQSIEALNDRIGQIFCYMLIPTGIVVIWEVVLRYLFDSPTTWSFETSEFLFGTMAIMAGGYVQLHEAHVNMPVFVVKLSPRARAVVNVLISPVFFLFCLVLVWKGFEMFFRSLILLEHSSSFWGPPLYPIKATLPIGATLLFLQGFVKFVRDLHLAITGKALKWTGQP